MEKSLFPKDMMNSYKLDLESIAGKLLTFSEQLHLVHWQTESYAEHVATGEMYEYLQTFRDDIVEKLMGYTGRKPLSFKIDSVNSPSSSIASELLLFADSLKKYAESNKFLDISNLADELSGRTAKFRYLLTLR